MKKAFKSSTIQDQQVVSKNSIPTPVAHIYNQSDNPPPLSILTPYRYDSTPPSPLPHSLSSGGPGMLPEAKMCSCAGWDHLRGLLWVEKEHSENSNCCIIPSEMLAVELLAFLKGEV